MSWLGSRRNGGELDCSTTALESILLAEWVDGDWIEVSSLGTMLIEGESAGRDSSRRAEDFTDGARNPGTMFWPMLNKASNSGHTSSTSPSRQIQSLSAVSQAAHLFSSFNLRISCDSH